MDFGTTGGDAFVNGPFVASMIALLKKSGGATVDIGFTVGGAQD